MTALSTSSLNAWLSTLPHKTRLLLAYSGGMDSEVLLHLLQGALKAFPQFALKAIHVHHNLHPDATKWAQQCRHRCEAAHTDFELKYCHVARQGEGLEAAARTARYAALYSEMDQHTVLVTAHHQSDQVETVLLNLCRGAGVLGLAAMPSVKALQVGSHHRPLLAFTRDQLLAYANVHDLTWLDDPSNQDTQYDRNFIRHEILPRLKTRWPQVEDTIASASQHCAQADAALAAHAPQIPSAPVCFQNEQARLDLHTYHTLSAYWQRYTLRAWIQTQLKTLPSSDQIERIIQEVIGARPDASPQLKLGDVWLGRHQHQLVLFQPFTMPDPATVIDLHAEDLDLNTVYGIQIIALPTEAFDQRLTIRFRGIGKRFHPAGRAHSQTLKKLMQGWGIPPWLRAQIPLLYHGEQLIAVANYGVSSTLKARYPAFEFIWSPNRSCVYV